MELKMNLTHIGLGFFRLWRNWAKFCRPQRHMITLCWDGYKVPFLLIALFWHIVVYYRSIQNRIFYTMSAKHSLRNISHNSFDGWESYGLQAHACWYLIEFLKLWISSFSSNVTSTKLVYLCSKLKLKKKNPLLWLIDLGFKVLFHQFLFNFDLCWILSYLWQLKHEINFKSWTNAIKI